jgi:menaquinone-dependent protoporphyrinogen oxidase
VKQEVEMEEKILVAYASKYGATQEIAEKIGVVLKETGFAVDVLAADRVAGLAPYRAVVLGSAVYIGGWRKAATRFLKTHQKELAAKPVWLFSSGPTGKGDPVELVKGWRFPKALQHIADRVAPREIVVFQGAVFAEKLGAVGRWMIKNVKAPVGDFRDWNAITAWAGGIAAALKRKD